MNVQQPTNDASPIVSSSPPAIFSRESIELLILLWFATSPLASFYLRFPHDRSVITFDRAVFGLIALMLLILWWRASIKHDNARTRPFLTATRFEIAWVLLSILALLSAVLVSNDFEYATKIAVDSFCLPLLAFHVARHHLNVTDRARVLTVASMGLAFFLALTGAYEFFTSSNLFFYKGSDLLREGEVRVNGPFASDSSYAIICLLITLFLAAIPSLLRVRFDTTGRLVYAVALAAGIGASLLPLFRSVALAIVICLAMIEIGLLKLRSAKRLQGGESKRRLSGIPGFLRFDTFTRRRVILFAAVVLALVVAESLLGGVSIDRRLANPRTAFGRLSTWAAAAEVTLDNPVFGVGLTNYTTYFDQKYSWAGDSDQSFFDVRAADSPHSNPLWMMSEMGAIGFVLYIIANGYIFLMGYRALKRADSDELRLAAISYLAVTLAYWIPGLTLASGYYSDLNLYFFFMLGVLSNGKYHAASWQTPGAMLVSKSTIRTASAQDTHSEPDKNSPSVTPLGTSLGAYALLGSAAVFLLSLIEWIDLSVQLTPVFESFGERAAFTAYFSLNLLAGLIIGLSVGLVAKLGSFFTSKLQRLLSRKSEVRLQHKLVAGFAISSLAAALFYYVPAVFRFVLGVIREAEKVPQLTNGLLNRERPIVYLSILGLLVSCWMIWSITRNARRLPAPVLYGWLVLCGSLIALTYYVDSRIEVQLYEPSLHRSLFLLELTLSMGFIGSLYFWRVKKSPVVSSSRALRVTLVILAAGIIAGLIFTFSQFDKNQNLKTQVFFRTTQTKQYFKLAQWVLDFDRDGYSALLGGGDADDNRAAINPSQPEIVADGEDNNCIGGDLSQQELDGWLQEHNKLNKVLNPEAKRFNVIFIFVDAFRADHLSVYGYGRDTTPNLRAFAERASVFENAFTPSPYTFEAFPKFMKSSYWDANVATWTEVFASNGYNTILFPRRTSTMLRYVKGISQVVRDGTSGLQETIDTTIEVLGKQPTDRSTCAFVYIPDPHMPYIRHDEHDFGSSIVDLYDGEVAHTDRHLGRLFDWLQQSGKLDNTVVVVMSDHGESLGERAVFKHTTQLYNEQAHVPMIVHVPALAPRRISDYVSTVDLGSTILNAVGIDCPQEYTGISLLPLLRGETFTRPPVYGEQTMTEDSRYVPLDQYVYPSTKKYMIITQDGYKLIYNRDVNSFELFNLKDDTKEQHNLFDRMPERAGKMRTMLYRFVDVVSASRPQEADEKKYNLGLKKSRSPN